MMNKFEMSCDFSVIIPAFNEAEELPGTLRALAEVSADGLLEFEIIVVDNGSKDRTAEIAESMGATVLSAPEASVAGVRNAGAAHARGRLLVFIDADVHVTQLWYEGLQALVERLPDTRVTGSRCLSNLTNNSWLHNGWYSKLADGDSGYINAGHLIVHKSFFESIGGFDDTLTTAEDVEFCARAKRAGADIFNDAALEVFHTGYPSGPRDFLRRERWHGLQDFLGWRQAIRSRVVWLTAIHLLILIGSFALILEKGLFFGLMSYVCGAFCLLLAAALFKFRRGLFPHSWASLAVMYLYILGRSIALLDALRGRNIRRE